MILEPMIDYKKGNPKSKSLGLGWSVLQEA